MTTLASSPSPPDYPFSRGGPIHDDEDYDKDYNPDENFAGAK